jgi:hypothetical protein
MTESRQSDSAIRRRTPDERAAYIAGMRAGVELVTRCLGAHAGLDLGHWTFQEAIRSALAQIDLAESV